MAISQEVGLLDHMPVLFLKFWGISILFYIKAVPFTLRQTVWKISLSSISSSALVISCFFDNIHLNGSKAISHCGFSFVLEMLSTFSYTCWPFVSPLGNIYSGPLPICNKIFFLFGYWVVGVPYIFSVLTTMRYIVWKYFLTCHSLPFHSDCVNCCIESF